MIMDSIAKLAEIQKIEGDKPQEDVNYEPEPSPKIFVSIKDTWNTHGDNLDETCAEIFKDFASLEMQYRLRENWLDMDDNMEKPFPSDISAIFTKSSPA
mmetsp:Transcript_43381/g.51016  ORF Transcript_43381/g.51016 Transcript_43381/m.51016 type:complete len:99 (+) Transcript_43381:1278-1574(+)